MTTVERNYRALSKILTKDDPYEIGELIQQKEVKDIFYNVHQKILIQHSRIKDKYYSENGKGILDLRNLDHFLILCLRFGNALFHSEINNELAKIVFHSSRMRTSTDIFYSIEIGDYFLPKHPIGAILGGHSRYGKGLRLYQYTHVGPYNVQGKSIEEWEHPVIGDGVILYGYSRVSGNSVIGNNVIVSMGTTIVNRSIPDNSVVMHTPTGELKILPNLQNNMSLFGF